ncbi:uncharacterized protein LAJ45_07748 [Morchella importuna]|uniref:uncharacterized protein n=1 Tax=Morchella importuna TaxID=1174673 RepID=UPI001E8E9D3D|nr:uncharacterized protein LAJ45_07748 [Morchella importuna]KAH8148295.1 hypothetical protein LAJ45_07748 [Morchella importuna]
MNGWVVRKETGLKRDAILPPEHSSLAKHPLLLDTQSAGVFELNDTFPSRTRRKIPPGGEGEGEEGEGGSKPNEQETRSHKSSTTADLDQRTTRQPPPPTTSTRPTAVSSLDHTPVPPLSPAFAPTNPNTRRSHTPSALMHPPFPHAPSAHRCSILPLSLLCTCTTAQSAAKIFPYWFHSQH